VNKISGIGSKFEGVNNGHLGYKGRKKKQLEVIRKVFGKKETLFPESNYVWNITKQGDTIKESVWRS